MTTRGVVPLICSCCHRVVGIENLTAWEARRTAEAHYFCRACMQLPEAEMEARLTADAAVAEAVWERVAAWIAAHKPLCAQPAGPADEPRGRYDRATHRYRLVTTLTPEAAGR